MQLGGKQKATTAKKGKKKKNKVLVFMGAFFKFLFAFIAVCICLGIMGGSALAVLVCDYVVEATANDGDSLELDTIEQSLSSTYYYADGQEYGKFISSDSHRIWVDIEDVPEDLKWAFICTEDKEFYTEPGVNLKRTVAATINEYIIPIFPSRQGASTLEQQLVKNLINDDSQTGIEGAKRKLREMFRSYGLYKTYSKETILESYLNTISFTGTIQGVQTAADEYFGKTVDQLTLSECAVIASITKNPTGYDPFNNPENLIARRQTILWNMYDQGKITKAEYEKANSDPIVLKEDQSEIVTTGSNNSYFADALFQELVEDLMEQEGWTESQAKHKIYTGGLTIETTADKFMQDSMEQLMLNVDDELFPAGWYEQEVTSLSANDEAVYGEDGELKTRVDEEDGTTYYYRNVRTQAAMATVDYEGNVLAMVGGLGEKEQDLVLNRAYEVYRQTGSCIKPLGAYAQSIEYGLYNWSSMVPNQPLYTAAEMKVPQVDSVLRRMGLYGMSQDALKAYPNAWRDWPVNYEGSPYTDVPIPLFQGLYQSKNTTAAWAGDSVGVDKIYTFLHDTLQLDGLNDADRTLASIALGGQNQGATVLQMASAYQIFNDGSYKTSRFYTKVYDSEGNILLEDNPTSYQALTPETAMVMNRLLKNVMTVGTAGGRTPKAGDMEAIGKTGTTNDYKDMTFVGATPYYVTSVWWGYDKPEDMTLHLPKRQASSSICADAWRDYMEVVQEGLEPKEFAVAEDVVVRAYCTESGLLATDACPSRATGYYKVDALPDACDYVVHGAPAA